MKHSEFKIGTEFGSATGRWRCTDVGSRVIVAISLEPHEVTTMRHGVKTTKLSNDPSWHVGPPYAVSEEVFDEEDIKDCRPLR